MTALILVAIVCLALTVLFGWAMWHLIYDRRTFPAPSPHIRHMELDEIPVTEEALPPEVREPLPTSQLHIPPPVLSSYSDKHTGISISGVGGSWTPLRRIAIRRRRWRQPNAPTGEL